MSVQRAHSMMRKTPQANHLSDRIEAAHDEAARLPAGPEKDALLGQAEQDEVALRVIQWMTSSDTWRRHRTCCL